MQQVTIRVTFGYPSPIEYECQPNIVILITDGLQTDTRSDAAGTGRCSLSAGSRYLAAGNPERDYPHRRVRDEGEEAERGATT